jgi:hypothetical protein
MMSRVARERTAVGRFRTLLLRIVILGLRIKPFLRSWKSKLLFQAIFLLEQPSTSLIEQASQHLSIICGVDWVTRKSGQYRRT